MCIYMVVFFSPKQNGRRHHSVLGYVCAAVHEEIMAHSAFG